MHSRVRLGSNRRIKLLAGVPVPALVLTISLVPAAIGRDVPEKAKTAVSLTTLAQTPTKIAPSKSKSELSENEIFDKLTGSDWRYPGDYWNIPDCPSDNRGSVTFNGENFSYPATQTWLPGRKIEIIISGIGTAGTVRGKALPPSFVDQFFSKLENLRKEEERVRKFPYQSPNGVTSLKWNFSKDDTRAGFIFLEDGSAVRFVFGSDDSLYLAGHKYLPKEKAQSKTTREQLAKIESDFFKRLTSKEWLRDSNWKVEPASTPPQQIKFARDGHFNLYEDEQGNWIRGPHWSLVNRDGMHIFFHPTGSYYKCYPFENEKFAAKSSSIATDQNGKVAIPDTDLPTESSDWEILGLEPKIPSDNELTLILHVPTHTKYGDNRYEHRFVAGKTK